MVLQAVKSVGVVQLHVNNNNNNNSWSISQSINIVK